MAGKNKKMQRCASLFDIVNRVVGVPDLFAVRNLKIGRSLLGSGL